MQDSASLIENHDYSLEEERATGLNEANAKMPVFEKMQKKDFSSLIPA
jgi:hypothetical protein